MHRHFTIVVGLVCAVCTALCASHAWADTGQVDHGADSDDDGWYDDIDCAPDDPLIFPGADEIPYDDIDQNCDGEDLIDVDEDGYVGVDAGGDDCDDFDATIHPGADDPGGDDIDQDCDGADSTCGCGGKQAAIWLPLLIGIGGFRRR